MLIIELCIENQVPRLLLYLEEQNILNIIL